MSGFIIAKDMELNEKIDSAIIIESAHIQHFLASSDEVECLKVSRQNGVVFYDAVTKKLKTYKTYSVISKTDRVIFDGSIYQAAIIHNIRRKTEIVITKIRLCDLHREIVWQYEISEMPVYSERDFKDANQLFYALIRASELICLKNDHFLLRINWYDGKDLSLYLYVLVDILNNRHYMFGNNELPSIENYHIQYYINQGYFLFKTYSNHLHNKVRNEPYYEGEALVAIPVDDLIKGFIDGFIDIDKYTIAAAPSGYQIKFFGTFRGHYFYQYFNRTCANNDIHFLNTYDKTKTEATIPFSYNLESFLRNKYSSNVSDEIEYSTKSVKNYLNRLMAFDALNEFMNNFTVNNLDYIYNIDIDEAIMIIEGIKNQNKILLVVDLESEQIVKKFFGSVYAQFCNKHNRFIIVEDCF